MQAVESTFYNRLKQPRQNLLENLIGYISYGFDERISVLVLMAIHTANVYKSLDLPIMNIIICRYNTCRPLDPNHSLFGVAPILFYWVKFTLPFGMADVCVYLSSLKLLLTLAICLGDTKMNKFALCRFICQSSCVAVISISGTEFIKCSLENIGSVGYFTHLQISNDNTSRLRTSVPIFVLQHTAFSYYT